VATYGFVQCVFDREEISSDEDVAIITSHFRRVDNNLPDIFPIIPATRENYRDDWLQWWLQVRGHVSPKVTFKEMRFYDVAEAPGGLLGDPVAIYNVGQAGTSAGAPLPPQVALSVTFRTEHRLRWGRFYIPGITVSNLDANGRWDDFITPNIATATQLLTARSGSGGSLTVFSRKYWNHEDPQTIQVDDIPDVIRRRRFSRPILKATEPAG
jgi:hypothetical protein